jgi:WD40 repeat protein
MRLRPTIFATALAAGLLLGSAAGAATIELSVDSAATLGGLSGIRTGDIVNYDTVADTATLAFNEDLFGGPESVDAYDRLPNGHMVFSTSGSATLGGISFFNGSLIDYDPVADLAVLIFDEALFTGGGSPDIDAVAVLPNGHFLISTDNDQTLGGLSFRDGDIVDYDPIGNTATLFFNEDLFGTNENVNAIDIDGSGMLLISVSNTGTVSLGGISFSNGDVVLYDPGAGTATLFFSEALFAGGNEDVDAVAFAMPIPEPGTASMLGLGLAGLAAAGRRRRLV